MLLIPAVLCLITLCVARALHKRPEELEERSAQIALGKGFARAYWLYVTAGALIAAGYADFSLSRFISSGLQQFLKVLFRSSMP